MTRTNPIIRILRSFTAAVTPRRGSLPEGQLAANVPDGKLYIGDQVNDPVLLASREAADILVYDTTVEAELSRIRANLAIKSGLTKIDDISSLFNNSTKSFNINVNGSPYTPDTSYAIQVMLDGVYQYPGSAYVVSGSQIIFYEAPTTGQRFFGLIMADRSNLVGSTGVANGSITPAKLDRSYIESDNPSFIGAVALLPSTESAPSLYTSGDPSTGLFINGSEIGFGVNGEKLFGVSSGRSTIYSSAFVLPFGTSAERPAGETGLTRINTESNELEFYSDGGWRNLSGGATDSPTSTIADDISADFNGTRTSFQLTSQNGSVPIVPSRDEDVFAFIDSTYLHPGTDFTVTGSTIEFTTAPNNGAKFSALTLTGSYVVGTVSPGAISSTELADSLRVRLIDGSPSLPSLTFTSATNSGIYWNNSTSTLNLKTNDTQFSLVTGGVILPSGVTSARPSSPIPSTFRFNTDTQSHEFWDGGLWRTYLRTDRDGNSIPIADLNEPKLQPNALTIQGHLQALAAEIDGAEFVFDGTTTTPTILRSKNIDSVVKNAPGDYTVFFSSDAPNVDFLAQYGASNGTGFAKVAVGEDRSARNVSGVRIYTGPATTADSDLQDYSYITGRFKW